jgi:hypothetical protein
MVLLQKIADGIPVGNYGLVLEYVLTAWLGLLTEVSLEGGVEVVA